MTFVRYQLSAVSAQAARRRRVPGASQVARSAAIESRQPKAES